MRPFQKVGIAEKYGHRQLCILAPPLNSCGQIINFSVPQFPLL